MEEQKIILIFDLYHNNANVKFFILEITLGWHNIFIYIT